MAAAGKSIEVDHEAWAAAQAAAGEPATQLACYTCGGPHLNVDCPEDSMPSAAARALAAHLRSSPPAPALPAAAAVLRCVARCATRARRASAAARRLAAGSTRTRRRGSRWPTPPTRSSTRRAAATSPTPTPTPSTRSRSRCCTAGFRPRRARPQGRRRAAAGGTRGDRPRRARLPPVGRPRRPVRPRRRGSLKRSHLGAAPRGAGGRLAARVGAGVPRRFSAEGPPCRRPIRPLAKALAYARGTGGASRSHAATAVRCGRARDGRPRRRRRGRRRARRQFARREAL